MNLKQIITVASVFLVTLAGARDYQIISTDEFGNPAELDSYQPSISSDAQYLAFTSESSNLAELTTQHADFSNIFVKDLLTGEVNVISAPLPNTHQVINPSIADDGKTVVARASTYDGEYIFAKNLASGESMISKQLANALKIATNAESWYYNVADKGGYRSDLNEFPLLENAFKQTENSVYSPQGFDISASGKVAQINLEQNLKTNPKMTYSLSVDGNMVYQTQNDSFVSGLLSDSLAISADGAFVLFAEKKVSSFKQTLGCELKLLDVDKGSLEIIILPPELSIEETICNNESTANLLDISADTRYILINAVAVESLDLVNTAVVYDRLSGRYEFVFVDENDEPLEGLLINSPPLLSDDGASIVFASSDRRLNPELKNTQILISENPLFNQ